MKKTQNRRVIILTNLNSKYFEQAVFYIKSGAVCSEDLLIKEANSIVAEFSKKYSVPSKKEKNFAALKKCAAILGVFALCAIILYISQ